jgi:hypothetical protein
MQKIQALYSGGYTKIAKTIHTINTSGNDTRTVDQDFALLGKRPPKIPPIIRVIGIHANKIEVVALSSDIPQNTSPERAIAYKIKPKKIIAGSNNTAYKIPTDFFQFMLQIIT